MQLKKKVRQEQNNHRHQVMKGQIKNSKRIKYFIIIISFILTSCTIQKDIKVQVVELKDSIQKPYVFINEIEVTSKNKDVSEELNKSIQKLSENKTVNTIVPKERLAIKKKRLEKCFKDISNCDYVPESYIILSNNNNLLNIKYRYNAFGNKDEWLKFGIFDLKSGIQFTYNKMFASPEEVLKKYNERYLSVYKSYMIRNKQETEEEREEYESYKEHLETREAFVLSDLNNVELVYNTDQVVKINFHYKGMGGNYSQLFPNDYIEFSFDELKQYMSKSFVDRLIKV